MTTWYRSSRSFRRINRRTNGVTSRTCRYGIAERPRPPRILEFQALDNHVSMKMESGEYAHQSEKTAANRMMHAGGSLPGHPDDLSFVVIRNLATHERKASRQMPLAHLSEEMSKSRKT